MAFKVVTISMKKRGWLLTSPVVRVRVGRGQACHPKRGPLRPPGALKAVSAMRMSQHLFRW